MSVVEDKLDLILERIDSLEKKVSKGKKRKCEETDPNKPKKPRPQNAYMYWCNTHEGGNRKRLLQAAKEGNDPEAIKMSAIAKKLGEEWRALPDAAKAAFKKLSMDHNTKISEEKGLV